MARAAGGGSVTRSGRQAVLALTGAAAMMLSGCSAGSSSPSGGQGAQCSSPAAMDVQVTADSDSDQLTITTAGIGGSALRTEPSDEAQDAPDGDIPLRELPPGVHVRIADLDDGEIVRTEVLTGGIAHTEALEEGEYAVGLVSVDSSGRISGLASSRVVVGESGGVISDPALDQSRGLSLEELEIDEGSAVAVLAEQEGAPGPAQWWLEGPGQQGSGRVDDDGRARLGEVADGTHTLILLEEDADAPGIAQRAASCRFGVSDGELTTPGQADGSS